MSTITDSPRPVSALPQSSSADQLDAVQDHAPRRPDSGAGTAECSIGLYFRRIRRVVPPPDLHSPARDQLLQIEPGTAWDWPLSLFGGLLPPPFAEQQQRLGLRVRPPDRTLPPVPFSSRRQIRWYHTGPRWMYPRFSVSGRKIPCVQHHPGNSAKSWSNTGSSGASRACPVPEEIAEPLARFQSMLQASGRRIEARA